MSDNKLAAQIEADLVSGWYNLCRSVQHIQAKYRSGRYVPGLGDIHVAMRSFVNSGRMKQTTGGYAAVVQLPVRPAKKRPKSKPAEAQDVASKPKALASLKAVMAYKSYHHGAKTRRLVVTLLQRVAIGQFDRSTTSKVVSLTVLGYTGQQVKQALDILVDAGVLAFTTEGKLYAAASNWQEVAEQHNAWPLPEE